LKTLFNTDELRRIFGKYLATHHQQDADTGSLGFAGIHYAFLRVLKPMRALAVGSAKGFIPAVMGKALADNGVGALDFVDAGYKEGVDANAWSGQGFWRDKPDDWFEGLPVRTFVMTFEEFCAEAKSAIWGYAYIDSDHSREGTSRHMTLAWNRLPAGAILSLHDTDAASGHPSTQGPHAAVKEFLEAVPSASAVALSAFPGLTLIQKQGA